MNCPQCKNPLPEGATTCERCDPAPLPATPLLPFIQGSVSIGQQSGGIAAGTYIGVMNVHHAAPAQGGREVRSVSTPAASVADNARPPRLFVSYAHADKRWRDELLLHLKPMLRNDTFAEWNDTQIEAGTQWSEEIENALNDADSGILLVTPAFLASDFIFKRELPVLLQKKVLWVPISASSFKETALAKYQALHDTARPLASLSKPKRDAAWVDICERIKAALHRP